MPGNQARGIRQGKRHNVCDDGFRNILQEEIEVFEFSYPGSSILPFYVSEQDALDTLLADGTQGIIVTRELTPEQREYMKKNSSVSCARTALP